MPSLCFAERALATPTSSIQYNITQTSSFDLCKDSTTSLDL